VRRTSTDTVYEKLHEDIVALRLLPGTKLSETGIAQQERALSDGDVSAFHDLDFDFHKLIYDLSECPLAFDVTTDCKQKIDRLCVLSLGKNSELESILADHRAIIKGLASGDLEKAQAAVRQHLSRLDDTIAFLHKTHPHYFE